MGQSSQAKIYPGVNVSDRREKWKQNYRCPDVVVYLPGTSADDCFSHYRGGPDLAIEILSPRDLARKKLGFYAGVGTRELLLIDRKPWALELYRLADGKLKLVGKIAADSSESITSEVLPISLRLLPGDPRPTIELTQTTDARQWLI
jgi:Uma2 family endonuclease